MDLEQYFHDLEDANEKSDSEWAPMRHVITETQLADIGRRITHDEDLNPDKPRPVGSRREELKTFGELFGNAVMEMQSRGYTAEEFVWALNEGRRVLVSKEHQDRSEHDHDAVAVKPSDRHANFVTGEAVGPHHFTEEGAFKGDVSGGVLVLCVEHARPGHYPIFQSPHVVAVVTEQGGMSSHAATLARETGVPALVGLGDFLDDVETGDEVQLNLKDATIEVLD